jgi:DNA-binding response OmpR family regulator
MRVLVAEDERVLADLVAEGLRKHAMAVDVVYDGAAASERLDDCFRIGLRVSRGDK